MKAVFPLFGVAAILAPLTTATAAIPAITGTLDLNATQDSEAQKSGIALLEKLPSRGGAVYLDLSIAPVAAEAGNPDQPHDWNIQATGRDGQALPDVGCAAGGTQMLDDAVGGLSFTLTAFTNHLVLDAMIAAPGTTPWNSLACDYAPSARSSVVLRLTGFFVVQDYSIPTARGVRLVPVTPSFEAATATLRATAHPRQAL
jgi:hypothetical protein